MVRTHGDATELAKKLANPIVIVISAPFQNNKDYGIGEWQDIRSRSNFWPAIQIFSSKNVNLITYIILLVVSQFNVTCISDKQDGLEDVFQLFSPDKTKKLIWGVGPARVIPISTSLYLATQKFGVWRTELAIKPINAWAEDKSHRVRGDKS